MQQISHLHWRLVYIIKDNKAYQIRFDRSRKKSSAQKEYQVTIIPKDLPFYHATPISTTAVSSTPVQSIQTAVLPFPGGTSRNPKDFFLPSVYQPTFSATQGLFSDSKLISDLPKDPEKLEPHDWPQETDDLFSDLSLLPDTPFPLSFIDQESPFFEDLTEQSDLDFPSGLTRVTTPPLITNPISSSASSILTGQFKTVTIEKEGEQIVLTLQGQIAKNRRRFCFTHSPNSLVSQKDYYYQDSERNKYIVKDNKVYEIRHLSPKENKNYQGKQKIIITVIPDTLSFFKIIKFDEIVSNPIFNGKKKSTKIKRAKPNQSKSLPPETITIEKEGEQIVLTRQDKIMKHKIPYCFTDYPSIQISRQDYQYNDNEGNKYIVKDNKVYKVRAQTSAERRIFCRESIETTVPDGLSFFKVIQPALTETISSISPQATQSTAYSPSSTSTVSLPFSITSPLRTQSFFSDLKLTQNCHIDPKDGLLKVLIEEGCSDYIKWPLGQLEFIDEKATLENTATKEQREVNVRLVKQNGMVIGEAITSVELQTRIAANEVAIEYIPVTAEDLGVRERLLTSQYR